MKARYGTRSLNGWLALGMGLVLLLAPHAAFGQSDTDDPGVIVRINGDATVDAGTREGAVVVVQGTARVRGEAEVVVVVNGTATLDGARVAELILVQSDGVLTNGAVVTGDVHLVNAALDREGGVVEGQIQDGTGSRLGRGLLIFGVLFGLGMMLAVLASGLVAAAVAPRTMRKAGEAISQSFAETVVAVMVVWIGLPILAVAAIATVIGIPIGIGVFLFVLPTLGFLGYLTTGIWLGDYLLGALRGREEAWHPYTAAIAGLLILLLAGWLPIIGSVVSPLAAFVGSGALALLAWQSARRPRVAPVAHAEA